VGSLTGSGRQSACHSSYRVENSTKSQQQTSIIGHLRMPRYATKGVTERCRLFWLTKSALLYEPKCGGRERGLQGLSPWVQLFTWSSDKLWRSNSIFNPHYVCRYLRVRPWPDSLVIELLQTFDSNAINMGLLSLDIPTGLKGIRDHSNSKGNRPVSIV
jgi:hypothetical protein